METINFHGGLGVRVSIASTNTTNSVFFVGGCIGTPYTKVLSGTTNVTLNFANSHVEIDSGNNANVTLNLPAATVTGREYSFSKANSETYKVTIVPNGTDTIEGLSSIQVNAKNESFKIKCDGTSNWQII
jgi:hypothetical protein